MTDCRTGHSFHIPVMGIGYSIDAPVKVAHYGITSTISLVDDGIIEKMRQFYCQYFQLPFNEITQNDDDYRAKRITAYLNLIDEIVKQKFEELKNSIESKSKELQKYFDMLPDCSWLKEKYASFSLKDNVTEFKNWLNANLIAGSIDVNIMTKLDKVNYRDGVKLPVEYCDAHAAFRGFANSILTSSLVLSAGMNPRLYNYIEKFDEFFPNEKGEFKKKITLKVSDFRSALIQGKYFAKKGIWISEYRVESGLNCGGHAYISQGNLMGTVLEEFKRNRETLTKSINEILFNTLKSKNKTIPDKELNFKITAQGGVGTNNEHNFLLSYYNIDSVGWATPFLLVPEVTNVDEQTIKLLQSAKEDDLYLSNISPYGVPFNNLRNNTKDIEQEKLVSEGKPGAPCIKKYGAFNAYFNGKNMCTGSREYQTQKIKELQALNLDKKTYDKEYNKVVEKVCICVGLGTATLIKNKIPYTKEGEGVSICPGPDMAYFSKILSLQEMVAHIYGRTNVIERTDRPHFFVKEIIINIKYLKEKAEDSSTSDKEKESLKIFKQNLFEGIKYYNKLYSTVKVDDEKIVNSSLKELVKLESELNEVKF
ncbi:MAG: hypothetical protein COS14_06700 [Bacteroidetes bacterium CG02_land_8_20_14_3_00_31_25]|nr:MAG: hypothetical protein COS14_06700 [Bacteroidetes bacterium CG02_land_8_20_14_3_00_31_25]PIY02315.1 MAG: hypothetical protein COZ21_14815 [Bacteroidetes bacterium CG_4_10_14_3_um_filter_31_20]